MKSALELAEPKRPQALSGGGRDQTGEPMGGLKVSKIMRFGEMPSLPGRTMLCDDTMTAGATVRTESLICFASEQPWQFSDGSAGRLSPPSEPKSDTETDTLAPSIAVLGACAWNGTKTIASATTAATSCVRNLHCVAVDLICETESSKRSSSW